MAMFPRIERSCPYLDRLDEAIDGDFCRMCRRTVHDLTGLSGTERAAFVAGCGGEACVTYRTRLSPAVAAAALAASTAVLVSAAPAQDQRHKPKVTHVRPVRVVQPPQPLYQLAGMIAPPPVAPVKPEAEQPPKAPPADRQPQAKRD